ncbi:F-type H+-transporting ATPase subunit epsilon [Hydrogenivirga caldilitoris]|uniref:ATP synthase epsilon chain n=1 Tax=Hydrogenivirga caldilitoris TaxID=246264 RepID=A0A497XPD6_9AQUI|nr:ATP synthase F1 subunit epsilon [Hydrogenivirga caldilitoris]RLJ70000.1 F-type H+-transporting ATPase subunit epsilon [Hydrogenivirga caldilitoris]
MIRVEIVTPQGLSFSREVNSVNIPTVEGEIGVLQNHMYLMTLLKPGLVYFDGDEKKGMAVTYGVVDVTPEKVLILAEEAYEVGEIDVGKAKKEFEEAMRKLATAQTLEEIKEWERVKEKAQALVEVVERLR